MKVDTSQSSTETENEEEKQQCRKKELKKKQNFSICFTANMSTFKNSILLYDYDYLLPIV